MNQVILSSVMGMYDAPAWKTRVANMPDNQVYAIYRSNQKRKEKKKKQLSLVPKKDSKPEYKQLTIWDWAISEGLL